MDNVLIALSGGVDSAVTALLLKEKGYSCAGGTMRLHGETSFDDARKVCEKLDIPFYGLDFTEDFACAVIEPFIRSYEIGETPNPCIECNRRLKFGKLYEKASALGYDFIATGHYARVEQDAKTGRFLLKKARNIAKDQSYVLYFLSQEQLSHVKFPLGVFSDKSEVRKIAEENGFVNANKHDSQDICFIPDGDYAGFIRGYTGKTYPAGDFLMPDGSVIGRHSGIISYTIGQRKGLGVSYTEPLFVREKSPKDNTVSLCTASGLYSSELTAVNFNLISLETPPKDPLPCTVRTRYHSKETPACAYFNADGTVTVRFDEPQRAIAPGQAVVLYDGDLVVGGGTITVNSVEC